MQIQIFKATATLATQYEAAVGKHMQAHERGEKHKSKMPKSGHRGGATPLALNDTVEFRVLTICAKGQHTPAGTKPDDVSNSKWSSTFSGLHRKKLLKREATTRTGALYQYTITPQGRAALKEWGDL